MDGQVRHQHCGEQRPATVLFGGSAAREGGGRERGITWMICSAEDPDVPPSLRTRRCNLTHSRSRSETRCAIAFSRSSAWPNRLRGGHEGGLRICGRKS